MSKIITQRPHPGPLLKTEVFKPCKLKTKKVAEELFHVNSNYLYVIIAGKQAVNLQMCHRLSFVFGENPQLWATRQLQYDLDKAAGGTRIVNTDFFIPENMPRIHPGSLFREKIMTPNKLSLAKTGQLMGIHDTHVSMILAGETSITLDKCLLLEKLFGENAEYWATLQMRYNLDQKREAVKQEGLQRWKPGKGPK